jgi:hypothetical protein
MKAYLYDTETGLYEGEVFEDADLLQHEEGITDIAPPDYAHGQVPIFDRQSSSWTVVPAAIARQLLASSSRPSG